MSDTKYTPGTVTTVGDLEVGDTIFLSQRRSPAGGLPVPHTPVVVTAVEPSPDGRILVNVRNANSASVVPERTLGQLPASREFRVAVPVA